MRPIWNRLAKLLFALAFGAVAPTLDQFGGARDLEAVRERRTEDGVVGKIFVRGRTVVEGTRARGLELERYRDEAGSPARASRALDA